MLLHLSTKQLKIRRCHFSIKPKLSFLSTLRSDGSENLVYIDITNNLLMFVYKPHVYFVCAWSSILNKTVPYIYT